MNLTYKIKQFVDHCLFMGSISISMSCVERKEKTEEITKMYDDIIAITLNSNMSRHLIRELTKTIDGAYGYAYLLLERGNV